MPPPKDQHTAASEDTPEAAPLSDERLALIELESLLNRPPSWRKRLLYGGLVIAALAVALAAFWSALLPKPVSTPTDPLLTGVLLSDLTYGSVTVNGQKQTAPPPLRVQLHQHAANIITLNAPPFAPLTCKITFPYTYDDPAHCLLVTGNEFTDPAGAPLSVNNGSVSPTFFVNMGFTWYDLSKDQQNQMLSAVNQTLNTPQQITVPAGAYYAVSGSSDAAGITSQRASAPLDATASLILQATSTTVCGAVPCPDPIPPGQSAALSGHVWVISFDMEIRWQFMDASGAAVGDAFYYLRPGIIQIVLSYERPAGWVVATQDMPNLAQDLLQNQLCPIGMALLPVNTDGSQNIQTVYDRGIAGCELHAQTDDGKQGLFLWRFGVLLAVDNGAQAMLPTLPIAPPDEIAAVDG
jgi:hypothetical protein